MTQVTMVGPPESNGGVGSYTSDLASALDASVRCRRLAVGNHLLSQFRTMVNAVLDNGDAVHVQYVYQFFGPVGLYTYVLLPMLFVLTRLRSKRLVVTMHEVWSPAEANNWFQWYYVVLTHSVLVKMTDSLVFLSERGQRAFHRSCQTTQTDVIPHGVHVTDTEEIPDPRERFDVNPYEFLVTQHGFVNERKGYETFLKVARRMPDQQFLVAGGPRNEAFEEYFSRVRSRAPENVTFTGVLGKDEFHAAFQASDVAFLPYRDIFQSGVFNWCAAYGTPAVASDIEYFADIADSYGCPELFTEGEPHCAVAAIREVIADQSHRRQLSECMSSYAEQNSFAAISSRYERLYAQT